MLRGVRGINPVNGKEIPIFISDYVLATYGTGAIMAVPAHDDRDWAFAKAFGCEIIEVVKGGNVEEAAFTLKDDTGILVNSDFPQRPYGERGHSRHHQMAGGPGHWPCQGEFQAPGLGFLPASGIGENPSPLSTAPSAALWPCLSVSRLLLPEVESYEPTGRRGQPSVRDDRLGEHHLPPLVARPRGDGHHAPVGRFLLVLPALYGSP